MLAAAAKVCLTQVFASLQHRRRRSDLVDRWHFHAYYCVDRGHPLCGHQLLRESRGQLVSARRPLRNSDPAGRRLVHNWTAQGLQSSLLGLILGYRGRPPQDLHATTAWGVDGLHATLLSIAHHDYRGNPLPLEFVEGAPKRGGSHMQHAAGLLVLGCGAPSWAPPRPSPGGGGFRRGHRQGHRVPPTAAGTRAAARAERLDEAAVDEAAAPRAQLLNHTARWAVPLVNAVDSGDRRQLRQCHRGRTECRLQSLRRLQDQVVQARHSAARS
mmetsp:Transcript_24366/g.69241  ORF Transcript_24366/g.69241 Transcript_24366/m.69241 type:complete len:271 (+) Transcript_24366:336-1148(+)